MVTMIGFISHSDPDAQDMLVDSLLYGLVRVLGQEHVHEYWGHLRYCGGSKYLASWPVYLGALAYNVEGKPPMPRKAYDLLFVAASMIPQLDLTPLDLSRTVIVNGSDVPSVPPSSLPCACRLVLHRPGCAWQDWLCMQVHITCPGEWLDFHKKQLPRLSSDCVEVFAAWSDNHLLRRTVMDALAIRFGKRRKNMLRFGSAAGYVIANTEPTVSVPHYLNEMAAAKVVVSCRGGSIDCLRPWECLMLGRTLVSDDFGCDDFVDGVHYLAYRTPDECVAQVEYVLAHPLAAREIANNGALLARHRHTAEAQAKRVMDTIVETN